MVQTASIIAFSVNILICFGLPIVCLIRLVAAKASPLRPVLVGAGVFILFQLILRIPLLNYVFSPMDWFVQMTVHPWLYGIFLGLTAGLFEEIGRWLGYKSLIKPRTAWTDGVAFGVGHGGIEAITLVGLTNINSLVYVLAINNGSYASLMASVPQATADAVYQSLTTAAPFDILLGGLERVFAFSIQIALSLLVLYAVRQKKIIYLGLAVLLHMLIDAPVVILPRVFGFSVYALETVYLVLAVAAALFVFRSRRLFNSETSPEAPNV